jgi:hypothetical protein
MFIQLVNDFTKSVVLLAVSVMFIQLVNDFTKSVVLLAVSVMFIQLVNDLYQVSSFTSSVSDVYTVSQ